MKDTLFSNSENKLKRLYILTPVTDCADMWEEKKVLPKVIFVMNTNMDPWKKSLDRLLITNALLRPCY